MTEHKQTQNMSIRTNPLSRMVIQ